MPVNASSDDRHRCSNLSYQASSALMMIYTLIVPINLAGNLD